MSFYQIYWAEFTYSMCKLAICFIKGEMQFWVSNVNFRRNKLSLSRSNVREEFRSLESKAPE